LCGSIPIMTAMTTSLFDGLAVTHGGQT
jgi:hypothetical protein